MSSRVISTGASPNSVLVFTLCDENAKGTALPDFLGQVPNV